MSLEPFAVNVGLSKTNKFYDIRRGLREHGTFCSEDWGK